MTTASIYQSISDHFGSQEKFADAIGASQTSVSFWVNGKFDMSMDYALATQKATNGKFKAVDLCPALKKLETAHQLAG
ncbi:MAG: helix-turn-helix domain-containing protein [Candidatus Saccharibacteria bacterium]|nr:helix-turn-helix domain-containing protein [Moraxellaceae bacterium]